MYYITVDWVHYSMNYPTCFYYELNEERYEQRKVEIFCDGRVQSADASHEHGSTFLSWEPHPTLEKINSDPQFSAREITKESFEQVWDRLDQIR